MSDDGELIGLIERAAREIAGRSLGALSPKTQIASLGIDSVELYEMFGFMEEELGIHLSDDALTDVTTIGDLLALLREG